MMSNYSIDENRTVRNGSGQKVGTADYDGQVRDGWQNRGEINDDRYTDQYGRDQGWVNRKSNSGSGSFGLAILGLMLAFGIFYLMYLGIKWLVVQGKMSTARASRSWAIASIFFPPFAFLALNKGYKALRSRDENEWFDESDKPDESGIAKAGIVLGYVVIIFYSIAIIVSLFSY
ncbi:MAG: hypothetical protein AB9897_04645 [Anaerolineaceae bacterium]